MSQFYALAKQYHNQSITLRRHLHQHPELSLKEQATSEYCQRHLQQLGYTIRPCWQCGFVADLVIDADKPFVAWRADMDALPIQECNQHDFVSKHDGVAHMCGHDSHMAVALTAATILAEKKAVLKHNIRFVFQPCEETPPGGALGMIDKGCLDKVDAIYGLHNQPELPCGSIHTRVGGFLAGADVFSLQITGQGGHAARPHANLDPIIVAAQLISNWQGILTRRIAPDHTAVLSVTQCNAGNTFNVIPDNALLGGTVRYYDKADRDLIESCMRSYCEPYKAMGYRFEWDYNQGYDPVINHAAGVAAVEDCARRFVSDEMINCNCEPLGFGEDFCYYLQRVPGAYFLLGSGNVDKGIVQPLHSSCFDIDEDCLTVGVAMACELLTQA